MGEEDFDMEVGATHSNAEPGFFKQRLQVCRLSRAKLWGPRMARQGRGRHTPLTWHIEQKRENAKFTHATVSDSGAPPQVRDAVMEKLMYWIERADV